MKLLLALSLWAGAAAAQEGLPSSLSETALETPQTELARRVADYLAGDAGAQAQLAERILRSSLGEKIAAGAENREAAFEDARKWVAENPKDAAHLAIGFAEDDRTRSDAFERSLTKRVVRLLALNPGRHKGVLGALGAAGSESKAALKLDKKLDDEEQRELVKRLFEGQGGETSRVLKTPEGQPKSAPDSPAGPAVADSGVYDRLSALNPTGYSPEVLALQSALNARRAPGAPKLSETGRLDHATLSHPYYELRYELTRVEISLRTQEAWAAAKALGREGGYSAADFADPATQKKLLEAAKGAQLPPRFAKRRALAERAAAALSGFAAAAERTRDPARIDRGVLRDLGAKQKEAARWLTAASIEADLQRLEAEEAFWTPELESLIRTAPAPEEARRRFLGQAARLRERLQRIQASDEAALAILESPRYAERWAEVSKLLAASNPLRRDLGADILLVARLPYALHAAQRPAPWWRLQLNRLVLRLAPGTAYARQVKLDENRAMGLGDAFQRAAFGDFPGARRVYGELTTR